MNCNCNFADNQHRWNCPIVFCKKCNRSIQLDAQHKWNCPTVLCKGCYRSVGLGVPHHLDCPSNMQRMLSIGWISYQYKRNCSQLL